MRTNLVINILTFLSFVVIPNLSITGFWADLDGGTITADVNTMICTQSQKESMVKINVSGKAGKTFTFLLVSEEEVIEKIQKSKVFKFKNYPSGVWTIYHVSYDKKDFNASEGMKLDEITGAYDLSNPLEITVGMVAAAEITLEDGSREALFCTGNEEIPLIEVQVSVEELHSETWIIADKKGEILTVIEGPPFDFSESEEGSCYIHHVNYTGEIAGLEVGARIKKIEGCYALSDPIVIHKEAVEGGTIEGDSLFFCVGNNNPDKIKGNDIKLVGESKPHGKWIITDTSGFILSLPNNPHQPNFDSWDPGICYLWHLAIAGNITGLEVGASIVDLEGCYDLSNNIVIVKTLSNGGHLENGIVKACVEEGEGIFLSEDDFTLTDTAGMYFQWVVTERNKIIVGFGDSLSQIDLSATGLDKFFVYFLAYGDDMQGLEIGNRISDLSGCFDFSNQVPVNISQPLGGVLSGEVVLVCDAEDGGMFLDFSTIELTGAEGGKSIWIIADENGELIDVVEDLGVAEIVPTDTATYIVYHMSYVDPLAGLEVGGNINDIEGCFNLSNGIGIGTEGVEAALLEGGPFTFCLEGEAAFIDPGSIVLIEGVGDTSSWVITDADGIILGLPESPDSVNFAEAGPGVCFIWRLTYSLGLMGLEEGNNISELQGCFAISNSVEVIRDSPDGGILEGGPFGYCTDSLELEELVEGSITLSGNSGMNAQWVITDTSGNILSLPATPYEVDYIAIGPGECIIWHVSYADSLVGLDLGNNISALEGCFDFSNSISVIKEQADAGEITGGPFSFCVGDGIPDTIPNGLITLTGNTGDTSLWVITDTSGVILGLLDSLEELDFDGAGTGLCLLMHLTFTDINGLELGASIADLSGCYDLSNSIEVNRGQPDGGMLDGGPFSFCVGDGLIDTISNEEILLFENEGSSYQLVVTDTSGVILSLPSEINEVNFDDANGGRCLIWNIAYEAGIEGLTVDSLVQNISGCFDFSDSLIVDRFLAFGGNLTLDSIATDTVVCTDDATADLIFPVLIGAMGDSSKWIVTNDTGLIVGVSDSSSFDFEGMVSGVNQIWHISHYDEINGLEVDSILENLEGCFSLSNPLTITKLTGEDCTVGLAEENNLEVRALQNPVNDEATITILSEKTMGLGVLTVRNMEGQAVLSKSVRMVEDLNQQLTLDLFSLREGMYFVTIEFAGGVETIKIIKQ